MGCLPIGLIIECVALAHLLLNQLVQVVLGRIVGAFMSEFNALLQLRSLGPMRILEAIGVGIATPKLRNMSILAGAMSDQMNLIDQSPLRARRCRGSNDRYCRRATRL